MLSKSLLGSASVILSLTSNSVQQDNNDCDPSLYATNWDASGNVSVPALTPDGFSAANWTFSAVYSYNSTDDSGYTFYQSFPQSPNISGANIQAEWYIFQSSDKGGHGDSLASSCSGVLSYECQQAVVEDYRNYASSLAGQGTVDSSRQYRSYTELDACRKQDGGDQLGGSMIGIGINSYTSGYCSGPPGFALPPNYVTTERAGISGNQDGKGRKATFPIVFNSWSTENGSNYANATVFCISLNNVRPGSEGSASGLLSGKAALFALLATAVSASTLL